MTPRIISEFKEEAVRQITERYCAGNAVSQTMLVMS